MCMCLAKRLAARTRWSLVSSLAASSTSRKCGGSMHSPALRSVSRVPIFCMACISSTHAITGLHLQSFDFFVQGSELYCSIGTFQSSASARTSDLPTTIPNSCTNVCSASTTPAVGPRRPLLVFSLAHSITSECGGMHTVSVVSAKHSMAAWNRWSWMVSYPPPDKVPSTKSRMNGSFVASPKISIPSMA